jgi:hypothetical protein
MPCQLSKAQRCELSRDISREWCKALVLASRFSQAKECFGHITISLPDDTIVDFESIATFHRRYREDSVFNFDSYYFDKECAV